MTSIWELKFDDIISPALQKVTGVAKEAFGRIEHMELGMKRHTEEGTEALHEQHTMLSQLREAAVEFFAVEKFLEMGKEIFSDGMAIDMLRVQMNTLTGSVESGNEAFETLNNLYKQFPILGKENTMRVGEQLLTVGVHVDQLGSKIYQMASIAGGNTEKLNDLASAYGRAVAYGSVQARQLLQQPVLMQELGRMYHMNGAALRKFATEGNISLSALDEALTNLTKDGGKFHNMLENLSNGPAGHVAHLKMEWEETAERIFTALEPFINRVSDLASEYLPKLADAIADIWNAASGSAILTGAFDALEIGVRVAWRTLSGLYKFLDDNSWIIWGVAGAIAGYNIAIGIAYIRTAGFAALKTVLEAYEIVVFAVANATSLWAAAVWLLDVAMDANPIGVILGVVGALVGVVIYAWNHFEGFRKFLYSLWETFKQVFSNIGDFFKEIFSPIVDFIKDFKSGNFLAAAADIGKLMFNLSPAGLVIKSAQFAANGGFTKGLGDAWARGQKQGVAGKIKDSFAGKPPAAEGKPSGGGGAGNGDTADGTGGGGSGGSTGKNITINIQQLGPKELVIHAAKGEQGLHEYANQTKKVMIAMLNDSTIM